MNGHEYEVGLHKSELDTPSLLIDLAAMERNLKRMAEYFRGTDVKVRPHVKLHKATPILAHMQLEAGAIGLTCAKLAEAELLASSGIKDILIANQVVGRRKIERLVNLASYADVMVAVDSYENLADMSKAAEAKGVQVRVLVEVDIGNNRCGVEPFEPTLALAKAASRAPGIKFMGLMAYDGHLTMNVDPAEREELAFKANQIAVSTREYVEKAGIPVEIVSTSGTFTYKAVRRLKGITEVQPGTYLLMDTAFQEKGVTEFELALSVLATVVSRPCRRGTENMAIIDVGRKAMDTVYGFPQVKYPEGATVFSMPQEHSRLSLTGEAEKVKVGDKVELWVRDANGTINLYDRFYAMRNDVVEAVWDIPGRGQAT